MGYNEAEWAKVYQIKRVGETMQDWTGVREDRPEFELVRTGAQKSEPGESRWVKVSSTGNEPRPPSPHAAYCRLLTLKHNK